MKTTFFAFSFLFIGMTVSAQESINVTGADILNASGSMSASVGQTFYETVLSSEASLAPGVQQAYEVTEVLGIDITEIDLSLNIFPNPTQDLLNLTVDLKNYSRYRYDLFDASGKLLKGNAIGQAKTAIPMTSYPSALYYLKVSKGGKVIKVFKVIKTNK